MKTLKRIGSIAVGAVMLGSAIAGAVSAAMDNTGLTKDFFYDAGYNPIVQIVVGEKGMATDAVAAGNIAAVIGNLAYKSTTAAATGGGASGQVVLGVSAKGATGKYEQAVETDRMGAMLIKSNLDNNTNYDFYNTNEGLYFNSSTRHTETYARGEFVSYSLACNQQQRTEAGILKKGTYNNVHCLFCETLCLSALQNPEHTMEESIAVNYDKITYYEAGLGKDDAEKLTLKIATKAIMYILDTGYLPMDKIRSGTDPIDFEWRGQFILFGEEYFTKNIQGYNKIYLAKGKILDDISSEGYTAEYMGYKFKIDHLIYSEEYKVAGILLDVEKPDGTVVQTQISKMANGIVDDIEVAGVYAEEADAVATASLIVYDTTTNVLLEDGKDMELGGEVKKYWKVAITHIDANDSTVDISDYNEATSGTVLTNVTVEYRHTAELAVGESLAFPSTYKLTFTGFRTTDFVESPCSGAGEGNIKIEREGKSRATISFTGDDGQRYNGVYIDAGPFGRGDMFMANGLVYEYDEASEPSTEPTNMKVTLKDLLNGGKTTYTLEAIASTESIYMYTYPFEDVRNNREDITINIGDDDRNTSDTYVGGGPAQQMLYDGSELYLIYDQASSGATAIDYTNAVALLQNHTLGVDQAIFSGTLTGSPTPFSKFELDDQALEMTVFNENGTGTPTPSNDDRNKDRRQNGDDHLLQLKNGDNEYIVVDFYDRSFNDSSDTYYSEGVWTSGNALSQATAWTEPGTDVATDYAHKWDNEEDTVAITPEGGTTATIDYGGAREVDSVTICQPQKHVAATLFLGTTEQATTIDTTITKADEGSEKTVGCCTYLVKEFGVSTTGASAATVTVNPIVGSLVVPEIAANAQKNLIVVGGPAVNGLSGLTKDEIQAATGQYVVKKDGNKVYVAGWTAADTVDAGNALITWLQQNVHA